MIRNRIAARLSVILVGLGVLLAGLAHADVMLLNVSYDPTRELYQDFNAAFAKHWQEKTGVKVVVKQSHGGSGKQARAVIDVFQPLRMVIETTGRHRYRVATERNAKPTGDRPEEKLEQGYFVMADQRTFVKDSRDFGPVSAHRLRGLVKRIVEVHGGRIWVESGGDGKGTSFCFTLPAGER